MSELILLRHGQTEWSRDGRHTGLTDLPLTTAGEDQARAAAKLLAGKTFGAVYSSPLTRAVRTADLAGLTGVTVDPDLREWDYGGYEGVTTEEIHRTRPGWYLWDDGIVPGDADHPGETVEQVGARVDRVLARVRPVLADGEGQDVCLIAHGHVLRILCARWLGLPAEGGRFFRLDTATVSRLGFEHARPVVDGLNQQG
ncbi:histidine phosphatase family protein [Catenulispora yoronensis]|uniref:Histidine phosphatase family protein n=1 Tax=Catenulispora yoronensis TaxID=450799 RepID=A0ABP5GC13_9ACTN